MKPYRNMRRIGESTPSQQRPLGYRAMNQLLERRRRLRKRIGMAVAMLLSMGLLLAGLE